MAKTNTKLAHKAGRLVKREYVIWLTTVGSDLTPQPRPVWFIWYKDTFLIFSQPHARKVAHLKQHPLVSLHFNTDKTGDKDVIVYAGSAMIDPAVPPARRVLAYLRKYRKGIKELGMTPEQFSREYSIAIRVRPTALRGW